MGNVKITIKKLEETIKSLDMKIKKIKFDIVNCEHLKSIALVGKMHALRQYEKILSSILNNIKKAKKQDIDKEDKKRVIEILDNIEKIEKVVV